MSSRESRAQAQVDKAASLQVEWEIMKLAEVQTDPADRNRDGIDPPLAGPDPEEGFKRRGEAYVDLMRKFDDIPEPGDFEDELAVIAKAMELLTGPEERTDVSDPTGASVDDPREEFEHLDSLRTYVEGWDGDAADAFWIWLEELPQATYYQYKAAACLRGAVTAERDMWKEAADNADALLDSVDEAIGKYEASLETTEVSIGFVIGVATAVLGGVTSGGVALPLVIGALSIAGSAAGEDWSEIGKENDVTNLANQPILIVEAAGVQLDSLNQTIISTEEEMARVLSRAADIIWKDRDLAHLRRPKLADPPAGDGALNGPGWFGDYGTGG